jgi:hypothetical protein
MEYETPKEIPRAMGLRLLNDTHDMDDWEIDGKMSLYCRIMF